MTKTSVSDWSATASNNSDVGGINIAENCPAANINNAIREMMAQVATFRDAIRIQVGDLYLSTDSTDPATKLGYGVWAAHASGRALVGVGASGTSDGYTWTAGQERGLETHALSSSEGPAHTHSVSATGTAASAGSHQHSYAGGGTGGGIGAQNGPPDGATLTTNFAGAHTHSVSVSGTAASSGGGTAHNNLQPSIAVYVWKRTA